MKNLLVATLAILAFNLGCASYYGIKRCYEPTEAQKLNADYGTAPTEEDVAKLKLMAEITIKAQLKDPYSAKFDFVGKPYKGWILEKRSCRVAYGYIVTFYVNAKNSYGGYTEHKRYDYLFYNGLPKAICEPSSSRYTNRICAVIE